MIFIMKRISKICLFLLTIACTVLDAQTFVVKAKVLDKETKEGLQYANIMVSGYSVGTSSNENGEFILELNDSLINEFLIISSLGYETRKVSILKCFYKAISLSPKKYELMQVSVQAGKKKSKSITLNKFRIKQCMLRHSASPFDTTGNHYIPYRPTEPSIEAGYFPYSEDYSYLKIKEASIFANNLGDSISFFRLRIYAADKNKIPLNDLLTESVIVEVPPGRQIIPINLEDYNLYVPKNGLFIGFELLIIPENRNTFRNELGNEAVVYSPFLYQERIKKYGNYWIYTNGEWKQSMYWYYKQGVWIESNNPDMTDKKVTGPYIFNPAISLILSNDL